MLLLFTWHTAGTNCLLSIGLPRPDILIGRKLIPTCNHCEDEGYILDAKQNEKLKSLNDVWQKPFEKSKVVKIVTIKT